MTAPSGERTTWSPQLPSLPPARNLGCLPCRPACHYHIGGADDILQGESFFVTSFAAVSSRYRQELGQELGAAHRPSASRWFPWVGLRSYLWHRLAKICCNAQAGLRHAQKVRQVQEAGWTIQRQERHACGGPLDWPPPDFFLGLGLGLFGPSCATSRGSIGMGFPIPSCTEPTKQERLQPTSDQSAKPGSGAWASQRNAASSKQPARRPGLPSPADPLAVFGGVLQQL